MTRFLALLSCGLLALASLTKADAAGAPHDNATHKIVYLADGRPILIELDLRIDGKPVADAYAEFMAKLFDHLDRDKDGVLSRSEMAVAPPPAALAAPNAFGLRVGQSAKVPVRGDGKMTREQLAAHYKRGGLLPFGIRFTPRDTGVINLNALNRDGNTSAEAINARLFELLDTDKDGKLSRKELEAAPEILARLDADEDEMLTPAELQGQGGIPPGDGFGKFAFAVDPGAAMASRQPFHQVGDGDSDPALGKRLLERYGKRSDKGLSAKQLGLDQEAFAALDRDGDGLLDVKELARFGQLTGDARFTVRLGKREDKQPIVSVDRANDHISAKAKGDGVELTLGNVRIELGGPKASNSNVKVNFNARDQYINQFRMADTDKNGYLDRAEADKSPFFKTTFAAMDRDGDGKLYEQEMLAYVDSLEELRKLANKSCLAVTVMDEGKGLFEMIDRDGDGRLSVRELRQMTRLLDTLDADRDGCISRNEVPRRYRGTFDLGASASGTSAARAVVFRSGMAGPPMPPAKTKGPLWFRKMDRNRDGDVSRKEWLGTEEEFRAIDTDGDGLISPEEAERYDKLKRLKAD
jgi:Ca2+-binding EF-hand superfamily protein